MALERIISTSPASLAFSNSAAASLFLFILASMVRCFSEEGIPSKT
jgi:hypothetical protein